MIMAGDWIKIEHGLLHKPEVMQICDLLDIGPHEAVGHLVAFWVWVDQNLSPICPQVQGTKKGLDRVVGRDGFTTALETVGWLTFAEGIISVPNYDVHLSNSAKQRAKDSKKKAKQRSKSVPILSPPDGDILGTERGTREEKRREEKIKDSGRGVRQKTQIPCPDDVDPQTFADWQAVRSAKRAGPVTQTVLRSMTSEADKAGITLHRAIEIAAARGWQAFKADWAWQDKSDEQPVSRYDYLTKD
jgi:hypothetical protein